MHDVYVGMCVAWHRCGGQRATLWSWFSPSTVMWLPGIEFGLSSLCVTGLYLLSHLSASIYSYLFWYMGYQLSQHHLRKISILMYKVKNKFAFLITTVWTSCQSPCLHS